MRGGSDCIPGCSTRWSRGGAEAIEIFAARGHFNYSDRQHVREIANWFRSTGIAFHSMHAPMHGDDEWGRSGAPPLNIAAVEKRDRIAAMDEIKRALEVAEQAPFQFLVQHVGVGKETASEQKLEAAMTSLEHLRAFAKPLGRADAWWRIFPTISPLPRTWWSCCTPARFTDVGVCFDVGHAHMAPGVPQAFETLKDRTFAPRTCTTTTSDRDAHLWPGEGTIDWKETMALLRTAPHVPPLLLEIEGVEGEKVSEKMAEAYSKLEV